MMIALFLCTGCTVYRGVMDDNERVCTGYAIAHEDRKPRSE